jgi:modulator of FtsH protease
VVLRAKDALATMSQGSRTMLLWHDFFVAEVGASAALVGLLFVATSINLSRIVKARYLVALAGQTLTILAGVLCVASLALFPDVNARGVLFAIAFVAAAMWIIATRLLWTLRLLPAVWRTPQRLASNILLAQSATLPVVIGSVLGLIRGQFYPDAIAAGIVLALVASLYSAWVLLVEILR